MITGCSNSESKEEFSFTAKVLENNETNLLVEPDEGSNELRSADKIMVFVGDTPITNADGIEVKIGDIEIGRKVELYYNGAIAESYPAQINSCYRVVVLD